VPSPEPPIVRVPSARHEHSAIYDPARNRMVMFGGQHLVNNPGEYNLSYFNDVWALSLSGSPTWSRLAPEGSPPLARAGHTAIYDPVRDRMIVFGGTLYDGHRTTDFNDVWALSLAGSPAWSAIAPTGRPPDARSAHTAIYDPVRDRMIVFAKRKVWELTLAGSPAWSVIAPAGRAPKGFPSAAIYDPVRDRIVVFGGSCGRGCLTRDVSVLWLSGSPMWSEIAPAGRPMRKSAGHTVIYDPVRDRMVVFGGGRYADVWALTFSESPGWSELTLAGRLPQERDMHTAIYDPVVDRMVVFGGFELGTSLDDVWELTLSSDPAWRPLTGR
jgi:galactose oxidase-like protein/Kelch motif protein